MLAALLATIALFVGNPKTARAQGASRPLNAPLHRTSKPKTAPKRAKVHLTPAQTADAILADTLDQVSEQGDRHFHEGEYNQIINLNRFIAQGNPGDLDAYANNAWLLWSTDRNDEAVTMLKQGLKANPDTYYMYDELGVHYLVRMKDPKTALPYFEQAIKFECPYNTWHSLAACYEKTNQWAKAVSAWESATKFKDDHLAPVRLERARKKLASQSSGN